MADKYNRQATLHNRRRAKVDVPPVSSSEGDFDDAMDFLGDAAEADADVASSASLSSSSSSDSSS